ncbi:flippase-like domain-containing protein [bacterium]|nr:flippase-like domain-containing protein [bacterium]
MTHKRKKIYRNLFVGVITSGIAIYWLLGFVQKDELIAQISNVNLWHLGAAFALTCVSYLLRAYRWPFFFKYNQPNFFVSYRCLILGFFANNVLPARLGEFVRAHIGGRATKQSRSYVLATIFGERLADGLMISLLVAVLFFTMPSSEIYEESKALLFVVYAFALAAVLTVLMVIFRKVAFAILAMISARISSKAVHYACERIRRLIEGLEPILHPQTLIKISLLSFLIWSVELCVYWCVTLAFANPLSLSELSLFLAAVNFSSLVPAAPGGVGVIEALSTIALVHIGVKKEVALSMVTFQHLIQYIAVGIPGMLFSLRNRHSYDTSLSEEAEPQVDTA